MTECPASFDAVKFFVSAFVLFLMHVAVIPYLFARWRQKYYWGFFPAIFSALCGPLLFFSGEVGCPVLAPNTLSAPLAASLYLASLLFFGFFRPELNFFFVGGEGIFLMILALPGHGALFAAAWLLVSCRSDRMLFDSGEEGAPLKLRVLWTVVMGLIGAVFVMMIAMEAGR